MMQTVFTLTPLTPEAELWMKDNITYHSWQLLGKSLCIEHRFIADIIAGMIEVGFLPNKDFRVA